MRELDDLLSPLFLSCAFNLLRNLLQDCLGALQHVVVPHVVVPEPQDSVATALQIRASVRIQGSRLHVLAAVDFNHQLWVQRTEVYQVRPDWLLAAKLHPLSCRARRDHQRRRAA